MKLLPAHAGVVVKLNLPAADPSNNAPPVLGGEVTEFAVSHRTQNVQFCRMINKYLGFCRQSRGNFGGQA